jgi:hypothetical protein
MNELMPLGANHPALRRTESRQLSRALGSLSAGVSLERARIEAAAEVQALRVDAVTYVGKRAMQDVAMLTRLEQQLALMTPLASGRLQAIGDITAIEVTEVVSDTLRQVR